VELHREGFSVNSVQKLKSQKSKRQTATQNSKVLSFDLQF
jgi:hypothetical protein